MPPCLAQISSAQRKESKLNSSKWIQLATIGIDNTPRVRTVVFRGWSESYEMEIYIDKRSQKNEELDLNNNVELCWLFSKSKCQFRFRGTSRIELGDERQRHWDQLSKKSKSMWSWPSPGNHLFYDQTKDFYVNEKEEISINFAILKIDIFHVDQLILHNPIHTRRRWIRNKEWIEERLNP